jgi:hypothetical protein
MYTKHASTHPPHFGNDQSLAHASPLLRPADLRGDNLVCRPFWYDLSAVTASSLIQSWCVYLPGYIPGLLLPDLNWMNPPLEIQVLDSLQTHQVI